MEPVYQVGVAGCGMISEVYIRNLQTLFSVKQVFRIIKQINAAGTTILLIEQNARQALGISDYTYVLENGHITLEGPSAQLLADPAVQKAYLGD